MYPLDFLDRSWLGASVRQWLLAAATLGAVYVTLWVLRRVLVFDTPPDKVAVVPAMVRQVVEMHPLTRFDRSHLLAIAESGLRVENVYYVLDPDYTKYADIQHAIYLELLRRFAREQIEFGFATRTVHLRPADGDQPQTEAQ